MALPRKTLDELNRKRQLGMQERVAAGLGALLAAMPDLGEDALAGYVGRAFPVVAGGQHAAASSAAGYGVAIAALAGHRIKRAVDVEHALERSGVLVQPDSRSLVAPVLRARALVDEGAAMPAAVEQAASYAHALTSGDLQAAQRVGVEEGTSSTGARVRGYRKEVDPACCPWCELVGADRVYKGADSVPFHDRDRCSVSPVLEGEEA